MLDVIQTRMRKQKKSACFVIKQPHQFSWTRKNTKYVANKDMLTMYKKVANMSPVMEGAEFFHNTSVKPRWAKKMVVVGKIGRHVFYKRRD